MEAAACLTAAVAATLLYMAWGFAGGAEAPGPAEATGVSDGASTDSTLSQADDKVIVVAEFAVDEAGKSPPPGWKELIFSPKKVPRRSKYDVVKLNGEYVLRASTDKGASLLYRDVDIDPYEYPYIVWRWRVDQLFTKADEITKSGDDYPARLYIGFRYDPSRAGPLARAEFGLAKSGSENGRFPPLWVLNYVWANRLNRNTWIANPWEQRSKVIAARSGGDGVGAWRTQVRNYLGDFKAITGEEPTAVSMIGVMIDGDNTGSKGTSYFGRIEVRASPSAGVDPKDLLPPARYEASGGN